MSFGVKYAYGMDDQAPPVEPSDFEVLLEMFTRAGIRPNRPAWNDDATPTADEIRASGRISVDAEGDTGPQRGYGGFYATFTFHPDGSLESVGAWE